MRLENVLILLLSVFLVVYGLYGIFFIDGMPVFRVAAGCLFVLAGTVYGVAAWRDLRKDGDGNG